MVRFARLFVVGRWSTLFSMQVDQNLNDNQQHNLPLLTPCPPPPPPPPPPNTGIGKNVELEELNLKPFPCTTNEVKRLALTGLLAAQRLQDEEIMLYGVARGELAFCCCCYVVIDKSDILRSGKWAVGSEEDAGR